MSFLSFSQLNKLKKFKKGRNMLHETDVQDDQMRDIDTETDTDTSIVK